MSHILLHSAAADLAMSSPALALMPEVQEAIDFFEGTRESS